MKKILTFTGAGVSECGSYVIYDSEYSDYDSIYRDISKYYNACIVSEESDEDRAKRLVKEKAEKRNKTIDLILS